MSTNAGCELPCWWGFKSGVSTSDQMQQQLARFIDSFRYGWPAIASKHDGGVGFTYPDNDQVGIIYLVPQNEIVIGMRIEGTYAITENYAIQDVLRKYPTPDEIWMYTWSEPMGEDVLQFIIVLDYSTKGFIIYYFSELGKLLTDTNDIQLCYSRELIPPKIILWNHEGENPFAINNWDYIYTIWPQMKSVEQATGLSMEEFIRWFTTEKELKEYCIKTPASLWKVP